MLGLASALKLEPDEGHVLEHKHKAHPTRAFENLGTVLTQTDRMGLAIHSSPLVQMLHEQSNWKVCSLCDGAGEMGSRQ